MPFSRPEGYWTTYDYHGFLPREYFVEMNAITEEQVDGYRRLVDSQSIEKDLDEYIRQNKELLVNALEFVSTGHQGAWVLPQQPIKIGLKDINSGMIPDYLLCGKSSDGFAWWVVEFKGANETLFVESNGKLKFSSTANEGINQILEYIDFCAEQQSSLRELVKPADFREPHGMLIIGNSQEFEDRRAKNLKAAWNRVLGNRIEIRTHDALIRSAELKAQFHNN